MVSDSEEVYIPGSSFHQAEGSESRPANHYYLLLFAERLQLLRKRAKDHIECLFSDLHRSMVSDSRSSTSRIELLKASVGDVVHLVRSNRHELARSQASPRKPGRRPSMTKLSGRRPRRRSAEYPFSSPASGREQLRAAFTIRNYLRAWAGDRNARASTRSPRTCERSSPRQVMRPSLTLEKRTPDLRIRHYRERARRDSNPQPSDP